MLCASLTNDSEAEVKGHAAEAVGRLAHVDSGVFSFHVLDLEAMGQNTVTAPSSIHASPVLCPEQQWWRVAFDRARQADVTS